MKHVKESNEAPLYVFYVLLVPFFTFSLYIVALFVKLPDFIILLLCKSNLYVCEYSGKKVHVRDHYSNFPGKPFSRNRQNNQQMYLLGMDNSRGWVKNEN